MSHAACSRKRKKTQRFSLNVEWERHDFRAGWASYAIVFKDAFYGIYVVSERVYSLLDSTKYDEKMHCNRSWLVRMMWPRVVNCSSFNSYCSAVTMIRPIQIKSIAALALLIAAAGIARTDQGSECSAELGWTVCSPGTVPSKYGPTVWYKDLTHDGTSSSTD